MAAWTARTAERMAEGAGPAPAELAGEAGPRQRAAWLCSLVVRCSSVTVGGASRGEK